MSETSGIGPLRVVLVDDHQMFRSGVRAELGDRVEVVGEAGDADEAIAVIMRTRPDVVLLDVNMPFMDGWQFLDAFHTKKANLSKKIDIYMISSSADDRDQTRAKSYGDVTDYLEKPITTDLLRSLLDRYNERYDS